LLFKKQQEENTEVNLMEELDDLYDIEDRFKNDDLDYNFDSTFVEKEVEEWPDDDFEVDSQESEKIIDDFEEDNDYDNDDF